MGQQMTPDTAKTKCKNFLATLPCLASDQPDSIAKNARALIPVRMREGGVINDGLSAV